MPALTLVLALEKGISGAPVRHVGRSATVRFDPTRLFHFVLRFFAGDIGLSGTRSGLFSLWKRHRPFDAQLAKRLDENGSAGLDINRGVWDFALARKTSLKGVYQGTRGVAGRTWC